MNIVDEPFRSWAESLEYILESGKIFRTYGICTGGTSARFLQHPLK